MSSVDQGGGKRLTASPFGRRPKASSSSVSILADSGASVPWLLAQVHVFVPKPIQSGGSDYACHDRNPEGPSCVNEVKVDNSADAYGGQYQCHD